MNAFSDRNLTQEQLQELFSNDEKCLELLASIKWADGFVCRKCGNINYCDGKTAFSRRCTRCKTEESATAGTIFHNCKFPVSKAFYIAYNTCRGNEDISTYEFARRLSLRQMTCWNFKTRIEQALDEIRSVSGKDKVSLVKLLTGR